MGKKLSRLEILEKFKKKHNNYYDYSLSLFKYNFCLDNEITIICPIHGKFKQKIKNHLYGNGCKKCGIEKAHNKQKSNNKEFIQKSNIIHNYKYDYSKVIYNNAKIEVIIICPFHGEFKQKPNDHLSGYGCNKCAIEKRTKSKYNNEIYLNIINKIHNNFYKYPNLKIKNITQDEINIICPIHGLFTINAYLHKRGQGCPNCNMSKGERKIETFLLKNNIIFEKQKTFKDCKYKKLLYFDFYLTNFNLCIEFDGRQHYENVEIFGGEKALKKNKIRDHIKDKYCEKNNIKLIRIKYDENILEKLKFL
jgi:very-short-patch-repair endonuclease